MNAQVDPGDGESIGVRSDPALRVAAIPELLGRLYQIVAELEGLFEGRRFTPDGHLVGSIGEVLAAHHYGVTLLPSSHEAHDAVASDGRHVQVKATQGGSVAMRSCCDHLLVLKLRRDGSFEEIFNGPGGEPWVAAGARQANGQRAISIAKLRRLMSAVDESKRLQRLV